MSEELPALATMSFSATILFSPPGGSGGGETRCCCCACKSETSGGSTGCQGGNPPSSTPITVTGHGLAVQSSEQLLHIIYQRVEKAVGLAEAALGLARANNELLKHLQEEVGELRQGKVPAPDEDGESRPHGSPLEEPGPLKESPGEAGRAVSTVEEECDSVGSGVQVVIEELRQLGAASAGGPGPLSFPASQRDMRLPGCTLAAGDGPPMLNPVSTATMQGMRGAALLCFSRPLLSLSPFQPSTFLLVVFAINSAVPSFLCLQGESALLLFFPCISASWRKVTAGLSEGAAQPSHPVTLHGTFSTAASAASQALLLLARMPAVHRRLIHILSRALCLPRGIQDYQRDGDGEEREAEAGREGEGKVGGRGQRQQQAGVGRERGGNQGLRKEEKWEKKSRDKRRP